MSQEHTLLENKVFNALNEAVLIIRTDGKIIKANQSAHTLLDKETLKGKSIIKFFNVQSVNNLTEMNTLVELKHKTDCWVKVRSVLIDSSHYCLIIKLLTFSELIFTKDFMKTFTKDFMKTFVEASEEGIVIHDRNKIVDCDVTFASMFGYTVNEVRGKKLSNIMIKNIQPITVRRILPNTDIYVGIKKDGTTFFIEIIGQSYQKDSTLRIKFIKDISERIQYEKQIEYMAYYDELTALPNRNYFEEELYKRIRSSKSNNEQIAIYVVDLDYFKEINDTLGYDFGDKLLKASAKRLQTFCHKNNMFIARMDGDEFLLLQAGLTAKDDVKQLAESIIHLFESPIKLDDYEAVITVSIGISIFPEHGTEPQDLIQHANSAVFVTKEEQRNHYHIFEDSISQNFKRLLIMESDLRKAVQHGQFKLHYQPQKHLKLNKVIGMEALLRWKHPTKGYIPPLDFIPLAEKTGLIIEIGDWVLREACKQNKIWQDEGYEPITVSVNLSAKQFHQKNFVEKIKNILKDTGLDPKYLELELTESMTMANDRKIHNTIQELRKIGVKVSIDDFGTGYSSLKYLRLFPISKLKIDKMFMDEKLDQNRAIVKSIIHMSHSLNMKVIAEGVETKEQLKFLQEENCDEIQGYYLSKPLPPDRLKKFLHI